MNIETCGFERRISAGEISPAQANAVVNPIAMPLRIVRLQMDYAKMTGKTPSIPMLLTGESESK